MNTGEVVAGQAREGSSFVTGDAVNVAARLEQAAEPGATVVGARTAEAVHGAFELGPAFAIDAKGKAEPVMAQTLVRALTLIRPRGLRGGARAFVGRGTELELLQAIFRHSVEQGEPHVVTLMGDAGVGKTTLVRELWRWLAAQESQPVQRTGRCLAYGHLTYWALGEILREHLGILESESQEEVSRRLGDREILGLALGLDLTGDAHPLAVRDRFQEAWVEFLSELAAATPTVLLVEDLHWAEDPLLDLLERVCHEVRGPLLVIGTARPELLDRRRSWGGGRRNASLVWLDALSPGEAAEMLDELVPGELSGETRAGTGRAGGGESVLPRRAAGGRSSRPARSWRSCRTRFRRSCRRASTHSRAGTSRRSRRRRSSAASSGAGRHWSLSAASPSRGPSSKIATSSAAGRPRRSEARRSTRSSTR